MTTPDLVPLIGVRSVEIPEVGGKLKEQLTSGDVIEVRPVDDRFIALTPVFRSIRGSKS